MPEGDTLFRTATVLREVLLGRTVTAARARPGGAADGPRRRQSDRPRRCPGQAPAHRLRCRPDAPHPPAHERLLASVSAGGAMAPQPGAGGVRHRGAQRGGGLLRCAGRGAAGDACAGHPPGARGAGPGPAGADSRRRHRRESARSIRAARHARGGGAAGPAGARRPGQRLPQRAVLHGAGRSVPACGRGGPGRARAAGADRRPAAPRQSGRSTQDHDARCSGCRPWYGRTGHGGRETGRRPAVGLRANRSTVSSMRLAHPQHGHGSLAASGLVVPRLSARRGRRVRCSARAPMATAAPGAEMPSIERA